MRYHFKLPQNTANVMQQPIWRVAPQETDRAEEIIKWYCSFMIADNNDAELEVLDTCVRNTLLSWVQQRVCVCVCVCVCCQDAQQSGALAT